MQHVRKGTRSHMIWELGGETVSFLKKAKLRILDHLIQHNDHKKRRKKNGEKLKTKHTEWKCPHPLH